MLTQKKIDRFIPDDLFIKMLRQEAQEQGKAVEIREVSLWGWVKTAAVFIFMALVSLISIGFLLKAVMP